MSPAELQKRVCSVLGAEKAGHNGLQVHKFHGFEVNLRGVLRCEMRICLVLRLLCFVFLSGELLSSRRVKGGSRVVSLLFLTSASMTMTTMACP